MNIDTLEEDGNPSERSTLLKKVNEISASYEHGDFSYDKSSLDDEPYFSLTDPIGSFDVSEKGPMESVATEKIIGSISPAFKKWSDEYADRPDRIETTAHNMKLGKPEELARIFAIDNQQTQRIKLVRFGWGEYDFYGAQDGTHRVASAKLAEIPQILAEIHEATIPSEKITADFEEYDDWNTMLRLGLIAGKIEESGSREEKNRTWKLEIESLRIPWAACGWRTFVKLNEQFERLYPGVLDQLPIPKEILLDSYRIKLNKYLRDNKL